MKNTKLRRRKITPSSDEQTQSSDNLDEKYKTTKLRRTDPKRIRAPFNLQLVDQNLNLFLPIPPPLPHTPIHNCPFGRKEFQILWGKKPKKKTRIPNSKSIALGLVNSIPTNHYAHSMNNWSSEANTQMRNDYHDGDNPLPNSFYFYWSLIIIFLWRW